MRIAFVFSKYPPEQDGGADYLEHLAFELAHLGHQVAIFTSDTEAIRQAYPDGKHHACDIYPIVQDWRLPVFSRTSSWSLFREKMKEFRPDVIHLVFPDSIRLNDYQIPFLLPFAFGCPVVTLLFSLFLRSANWAGKVGFLGLLAGSHKIVVHTGYLREQISRYAPFWGRKTELIPIGDNLAHVSAQRDIGMVRESLDLPEDAIVLGYYGDIDPSKGVDVLLRAVRMLHDENFTVFLLFVGGRTEENRFWGETRALIRDLRLENHVRMTGYLKREEVPDILRSCTMCVLPFRKNVLGRSSLISSISLGIPTITTQSPSDGEYLCHGTNVYMVPKESPQALATAIKIVGSEPALQEHLSKGALASAKNFRWGTIAKRFETIYAALQQKSDAT